MYIDFDEYPPYIDTISDIFEAKINAHIKWCHVYAYSTPKGIIITWINNKSWEMLKHCFPEILSVTICQKTTVFSSCKYGDALRSKINKS